MLHTSPHCVMIAASQLVSPSSHYASVRCYVLLTGEVKSALASTRRPVIDLVMRRPSLN